MSQPRREAPSRGRSHARGAATRAALSPLEDRAPAADPTSELAALPADLRSIITRPVTALSQRSAQVTQMAIAGGHAGIDTAVASVAPKGDVFLVEDALLGGATADLEPLYVNGAVPTTCKTLYYELIQSVTDAGWPSQQWVTDGAKYFDLTKAPEELPPLGVP